MIAEAGHYALVLALALALIQSTVPIAGARWGDVALMNVARSTALAQLLFVAVSFTAFPLSAQLAFLTMGPAFDAKLAVLYGATFRRGFIPVLLAAGLPVAVGGALLFGALT